MNENAQLAFSARGLEFNEGGLELNQVENHWLRGSAVGKGKMHFHAVCVLMDVMLR